LVNCTSCSSQLLPLCCFLNAITTLVFMTDCA
jgi:hypothetical protein